MNQMLFHYTNFAGLKGIIESKAIYATSPFYLNDESELKHAIDIASEILQSRSGQIREAVPIDPVRSRASDFLDTAMEGLIENLYKIDSYVCSFTQEGNLLSQWRGYGVGGGVSIGFDKEELVQFFGNNSLTAFPCTYLDEVKRYGITELIDGFIETFTENTANHESNMDAMIVFYKNLLDLAVRYKHDSFSEEKEWRIVCGSAAATAFGKKIRTGAMGLIPYVEVPMLGIDRLDIKKIIIGPHKDQLLTKHSLRKMLDVHQLSCDEIVFSEIPYRNT